MVESMTWPEGWDDWVKAMKDSPADAMLMQVAADWLEAFSGYEARAKALRFLGELGLVGEELGYFSTTSPHYTDPKETSKICEGWYSAAWRFFGKDWPLKQIEERIALLVIYSRATPATRAKWLHLTRSYHESMRESANA